MSQSAAHSEVRVGVGFTVVPDGVSPSGTCRLSIKAVPKADYDIKKDLTVDLCNWPRDIAALAQKIRVAAGHVYIAAGQVSVVEGYFLDGTRKCDLADHDPQSDDKFAAAANELWRNIFRAGYGSAEEGCMHLRDALRDASVMSLQVAKAPVRTLLTEYATADLGRMFESTAMSAMAATLHQRLRHLAAQAGRSEVVRYKSLGEPIRPGVPWWKSLHENWFSMPPPARDRQLRRTGISTAESLIKEMETEARALLTATNTRELGRYFDAAERARSLAMAGAHFQNQVFDDEFWRTGRASKASDDVSAPFRREMFRFDKSWGIGAKQVAVADNECDTLIEQAPIRKFAGILSYPTLSKFLRLIVDVHVDRSSLEPYLEKNDAAGRWYGAIAADFAGSNVPGSGGKWPKPDSATLHWSATVLGRSIGAAADYFGPCSQRESAGKAPLADDDFRDGLINLNTKTDGAQRFEFTAVGVTATALTWRQAAAEIHEADRQGALRDDQSTGLPAVQRFGIALVDNGVKKDLVNTWVKKKRGGSLVEFANDLQEGFRFDVALLSLDRTDPAHPKEKNDWASPARWRSLAGRVVGYQDIDGAFLKFCADVRDRDDGRTMAATSKAEYTDENGVKQQIHVNNQLFMWTGEGLGVPSLQHERVVHNELPDRQTAHADARFDLGVNLTFDIPHLQQDRARRPPPLREGRSYIFGARAHLINGCGVPLKDAIDLYVSVSPLVVRGDDQGKPIHFGHRSEVRAPDVLLPFNDRLVSSRSPERDVPGENVETLVVRSTVDTAKKMAPGQFAPTHSQTGPARRFVMPPRVSFDECEMAGVFDRGFDAVAKPAGAFARDVKFRSSLKDGTFPVARDGSWAFPTDGPDATAPPPSPSDPYPTAVGPNETSRGSVLVLDPTTSPPNEPFYPDPHARTMCAVFWHAKQPADHFGTLDDPVPFWLGHESSQALPIAIELRGTDPAAPSALRGWFNQSATLDVRQLNGGSVSVRALSMMLAAAEDIELTLWPHDDFTDHPAIRGAVRLLAEKKNASRNFVSEFRLDPAVAPEYERRLLNLTSPNGEGRQELSRLLCLAPTSQISARRTVRLVHAVDRPLLPPTFSPGPRLHAVVITPVPEGSTPDGTVATGLRSWSRYADAHQSVDIMTWPSEPHGSTTFFVGSIDIHRPSTVSVRCEATWDEYDATGVHYDSKKGAWFFTPRPEPEKLLFPIKDISTEDPFRTKPLDLLRDDSEDGHNGQYRGLSYSFPDSKARLISVSLIATSRFTKFFPAEPVETNGVGKYERESLKLEPVRPAHLERAPLVQRSVPVATLSQRQAQDFEVAPHRHRERVAELLWVPSTVRPAPPQVNHIVPVFQWETTPGFLPTRIEWCRKAVVRVHLDRYSWHSSGQGELLAVAFGPFVDAGGGQLTLCTFDDAVGEFGQFITRWGADPIHVSGKLDDLIPLASISGTTEPGEFRLPYAFEPVVGDVSPSCEGRLPAGSLLTVNGDHFINGATALVNNVKARAVRVDNSMSLVLVTDADTSCPLDVKVINPDLIVQIKTYKPEMEPNEGLWYCDLDIGHGASYQPFVQLGLARYQPHSVAGLELSAPVAAWVQPLPQRKGSVTFEKNRTIVVEHYGLGFGLTGLGTGDARVRAPRLNLRLLRASHPGRLPHGENGSLTWAPLIDGNGRAIEKLGVCPASKQDKGGKETNEAWWCERFTLPPCRPGIRYGLMIEETELMDADPEPTQYPQNWIYDKGRLTVKTIEAERSPFFLHVVDLGE
jgi:hypothetical protein